MKPINDRVVVKLWLQLKKKTKVALSFLIQPKKKPQRGEVVAVGPGKRRQSDDRTGR